MNEARFDDNGRVVHEKSRDRTIADHVITRASFTESCHGLRDKAWSDIDSDTRVSIVRALLGAMSDEEQALLPMPLLAEEASEAYQSALGAVHGTEGQLAAVQSVACRYGYREGSVAAFVDSIGRELQELRGRVENSGRELDAAREFAESLKGDVLELGHIKSVAAQHGHRDGDVGDFVAKSLAELSASKDDFERTRASERTLAGVLADAKTALENHGYSPRSTIGSINRMAEDLAAAKEQLEKLGLELGVALQAAYDNATDVETLRAELQAAKHAVRGYYEPEAGLASAINEIGEEAGERELEAEKLRGMLTQARCQLENSERELAAAKEASHGYFEELTKANAAADKAAVRVGLYSSDAAGRHGYGYDEDGDLARFIERLASKYPEPYMRDAMSRALEVTHPELGAPEWGQLLEVASDNAAIVRKMREAMRGNMGEE